ncbi:MAG: peptidoglycan-associated lipoprotein Pal [Alphaproteobacteria bacterium]
MKLRLLGIFAAVALVAACESASDQGSGASSGGASTPMTRMDSSGSSSAIQPGSAADFAANVGSDRVFFDFDKYQVRADAKPILAKWAAWMNKYPATPITIEGHADERGTREYNLALGERRATAVKDYLVSQGVSGSRLHVISFGKERPAVPGSNDTAWSQNRRGVAVVGGPTS